MSDDAALRGWRSMNQQVQFTAYLSEVRLREAIIELVHFVVAVDSGRAPAGVEAPEFSYLMTPKQFDSVNRLCTERGWPPVTVRGIVVSVDAVRHVLDARQNKDRLSVNEVAEVLAKAYSPRSNIALNKHGANAKYDKQTLIFNQHQKVQVGGAKFYAVAILGLESDGPITHLAPITCYHANEAKMRAIASAR